MKAFTIEEMENSFEIGRIVQNMVDDEVIEIADGKDAFNLALQLAVEFEKEYPDSNDYYNDLNDFVVATIFDEFGV